MADGEPPIRPPGVGRARGRGGSGRPFVAGQQAHEAGQIGNVEGQMHNVQIQGEMPAAVGQGAPPQPAPVVEGMDVAREGFQDESKSIHASFLHGRDYMITRPAYLIDKKGGGGRHIRLVANFFPVQLRKVTEWRLNQYRVDFEPEQDSKKIRKRLVKNLTENIPNYIYDGGNFLFSIIKLEPDPIILDSVWKSNDTGIELLHKLTFKHIKAIEWNNPEILQFYNILMRHSMEQLELAQMGRYYYDKELLIRLPHHKLEIWPGYKTVMRPYENALYMNVEMVSKVIRTDSVFQLMTEMKQEIPKERLRETLNQRFANVIVMTHYNSMTYKISRIDFDKRPSNTFPTKKGDVSFADYYKNRYAIEIMNPAQPLLICEPSKRSLHRGDNEEVILIPELCRPTGLTDELRGNFNLMRDLKDKLIVPPKTRADQLTTFMTRLKSSEKLGKELAEKWGIRYSDAKMAALDARVLDNEKILFSQQEFNIDNSKPADWTMAFRSCKLFHVVPLQRWAVICTSRDSQNLDQVIKTIQNVSRTMGYEVGNPRKFIISSPQARLYESEIDKVMAESQGNIDLIFIVLANNNAQTYAAVKVKCAVQYGVISQCFLGKNVMKCNMSVCTKVAIQMAAKQGGAPWALSNPLAKSFTMVVGFDVYHSGGTSGGRKSIGALVATTNATLTSYTSVVMAKQKHEISGSMGTDFMKLLKAFKENNGQLPGRIIFYRDGVGEGQLNHVKEMEVKNIEIALKHFYEADNAELPKFTFIVVSKRINVRFGMENSYNNPPPGTVVDDVVTLPERYDFYLVSQVARQGTVSPTSYNVIKDHQSLSPAHIQKFTYKMTHLYYNWSGTVSVPAVCQYAHKLAYLTGLSLNKAPAQNLSNRLHFL